MDYILRYNDAHIHSIPVGITTLSNTMYKQINTQAGKNISNSQPIKTHSKMFQSPKPFSKFNKMIMISFIFIGLAVFLFSVGSAYDIARNMEV